MFRLAIATHTTSQRGCTAIRLYSKLANVLALQDQ